MREQTGSGILDPQFFQAQLPYPAHQSKERVKKFLALDSSQGGKLCKSEEFRPYRPFFTDDFKPSWAKNMAHETVFYDIETRPAADFEDRMLDPKLTGRPLQEGGRRILCAVTTDWKGEERIWGEDRAQELIGYLTTFAEVVGYNSAAFDNQVLSAYMQDGTLLQKLSNATVDMICMTQASAGLETKKGVGLQEVGAKIFGEGRKISVDAKLNILQTAAEGDSQAQHMAVEICRDDVRMLREMYRQFDPSDGQKWLALGQIYKDAEKVARKVLNLPHLEIVPPAENAYREDDQDTPFERSIRKSETEDRNRHIEDQRLQMGQEIRSAIIQFLSAYSPEQISVRRNPKSGKRSFDFSKELVFSERDGVLKIYKGAKLMALLLERVSTLVRQRFQSPSQLERDVNNFISHIVTLGEMDLYERFMITDPEAIEMARNLISRRFKL